MHPPTADTRTIDVRLQQFYARQVHAVNAGDFAAYRDTFTADAEFALQGRAAAPVRGAAAIAEHSRRLHQERAARGVVQRHHVTTTVPDTGTDGVLRARSYTVIVLTPEGGRPFVAAGTECLDEFDETDGTLRIRRRRVIPDGAAAAAAGRAAVSAAR
jgi:3-phenylpropionate/cinnamic acid dioxygenase small subunit